MTQVFKWKLIEKYLLLLSGNYVYACLESEGLRVLTLSEKRIEFNQENDKKRHCCCRKGGINALDDLRNTRNTLAVGVGERLHDWRIHSCAAGYRNRCGVDQDHSGAKTVVTV